MARYIEFGDLYKHQRRVIGAGVGFGDEYYMNAVPFEVIEKLPRADVVPRADYDKVVRENEELKRQLGAAIEDIVHDCLTCKKESVCSGFQEPNPDRCSCDGWEWRGAQGEE